MRWRMLAAVVVAAGLTHFTHRAVLEARAELPPEQDVLYVPPAGYLKSMSLGYREALADLIWVRALIFSGENLGSVNMAWTDRYLDAIATLNPRFHRAYVWGGITAIYGAGERVSRSHVERAIDIYRRALTEFPESHKLHYPFGMLLTHQVASTPGFSQQEIEAFRREGVEHLRKAAAFGADPVVRQYAATLITDYATEEMAIQFLENQLLEAEDEAYRRMLRQKLRQLVGQTKLESIEAIRTEFLEERDHEAPYVPESVYAVIRRDAADW